MLREGETARIFDRPASRAGLPSLYASLAGKTIGHFGQLGGSVANMVPVLLPEHPVRGSTELFGGDPISTSEGRLGSLLAGRR